MASLSLESYYCRCRQHAVWVENTYRLSHNTSFHNDAAGEGSADLVYETQGDAGVCMMVVDSMDDDSPAVQLDCAQPPPPYPAASPDGVDDIMHGDHVLVGRSCLSPLPLFGKQARTDANASVKTNFQMVTARTCF